jgi:hypothetical protein
MQVKTKKTKEELITLKKKLVLLLFTREAILNSGGELFHLKKLIEKENREIKEKTRLAEKSEEKKSDYIKSILKQEPELPSEKTEEKNIEHMKKELTKMEPLKMKSPRIELKEPMPMQRRPLPVLRIPEPKLPPEFQYLQPFPTQKEIDLGKLNPLIRDPFVRTIECNGADKKIIVTGSMGRKPTNTILSEEEIEDIVDRFSKATRIPVNPGVYKVVIGKLILSAVLSDIVGSKFIIRKMKYEPVLGNRQQGMMR